jgi:hypothetical protein
MSSDYVHPLMLVVVGLFWIGILATALYVDHLGKPTVHTLLEHQRGLLFHRGRALPELGGGTYKLKLGVDYLVWLDMWPQPLQFERIAINTSDGCHGFLTLAGSMQVSDPKTAIFRSRHHNQAATAAVFTSIRKFASGADRAHLSGDREKLSSELFQQARKATAEFGVELTGLRISELKLAGAQDRAVGFTPELTPSS